MEQMEKSKSNSTRLAENLRDSQFHDLDMDTKNIILKNWVRSDFEMKHSGQTKPVWDCAYSMVDVVGNEVVAKTDRGEMVGKAIYLTIHKDSDGVFKHAIVVHVPASGSIFMVPGRSIKLADDDDRRRMVNEVEYVKKLTNANEAVEEIVREKRSKRVSGSHLYDDMMNMVNSSKTLFINDKTGYHQIMSNASKKAKTSVYLAKKGGKAYLTNFCIDDVGVKPMSEAEAREKHLGRVRGQIDFERDDATVMKAWENVLKTLG